MLDQLNAQFWIHFHKLWVQLPFYGNKFDIWLTDPVCNCFAAVHNGLMGCEKLWEGIRYGFSILHWLQTRAMTCQCL